jgi:signal transduction histidine kinase
LAQVLNTLAHEIRTPLAVSQGYLKLFLDGRLKDVEDTRRAMEQTRQALGALATYCVDMGKISALAESGVTGVPVNVPAADVIAHLRSLDEVKDATWEGDASGAIQSANSRELAQAIAIASRAAFDENGAAPHTVRVSTDDDDVIVLAGISDALAALDEGPDAPNARPVDFVKGGKGLKLIWAAFVLDRHGVKTWTDARHRASMGFRIPMVKA